MLNNRYLLYLIAVLTILSALIDLPNNYHFNLNLGHLKIDRIISAPKINLQFGSLILKKDFDTRLGLDLSGGTHLVMEADMENIAENNRNNAAVSAKNIVERRINLYGLTEPVVQQTRVGSSYRIITEIAGITNVNQAIDLIGATAQLTFREESSDAAKVATPSSLLEIWPTLTKLTGKNLKKSEVVFDSKTGKPNVSLKFDQEGAKIFADLTTRNVNKTIAIFLDEQLLSSPRVNEPITAGEAVIQGSFTSSQAKELAVLLNAGALPVPLKIIEQRNIGATLGSRSVEKSLIAGAIGFTIVGLFMITNYGFLGVIADVALITYTLITLAIFKVIPVTLTLAGIAGFILSIGMAVDANILIFERMKEELRWGRDYTTALRLGFIRAFPSIRDSNISSIITCAILYWFGTGIVRGFAITLAIGIVVSLFSAVTVTRTLSRLIYK